MSNEQAAVTLLSASDLAIMKKQYVSSFVVGRGILLSNKLLWRFGRLFFLFCFVLFFFFSEEIAFSIVF